MSENNSPTTGGTRVHAPDLDWSQVRETVLMLELAAGQVEAALRDSGSSVDVLTGSFTSMAGTLEGVDAQLMRLAEKEGMTPELAEIRDEARRVAEQVHRSIIAFQFYDRLTQRLDHVCHSLESLADLVNSPDRRYRPDQWAALQAQIASKFTMTEERAMFDAVLHGVPVKEALQQYMTARMHEVEAGGGDIELF